MKQSCTLCWNVAICGKYAAVAQALYQIPPLLNVGSEKQVKAGEAISETFEVIAAACVHYETLNRNRIGQSIRIEGRKINVECVNFPRPGDDFRLRIGLMDDPELASVEMDSNENIRVTDHQGNTRQVRDYRF